MRLITLKYADKLSGWELSPIEFFPDLTLLVGVSGVGKTRILDAIAQLRSIAHGKSPRGVAWEATFIANGGSSFLWRGEFEASSRSDGADEKRGDLEDFEDRVEDNEDGPSFLESGQRRHKAKVLYEELAENGQLIIERDAEKILLRGKETPKLSPHESALSVLSREEGVAAAHQGFRKILSPFDERAQGSSFLLDSNFSKDCRRFGTVEAIRSGDFPTAYKLALIHSTVPDVFNEIQERFIEVFPQVSQVTIKRERGHLPFDAEVPVLKIKETGSSAWIPGEQISSGMLRTLYHLARMVLWPDGTVILIDEFENSLGVNCLDYVTRDLVSQGRRLQFIITSHHPYIINNISIRNWKIVNRKGPLVTAIDATSLGLDASSHQSFIKLMNLPQYRDGIAVP